VRGLHRKQTKALEASGYDYGWLTTFNDMATLLMVFFVLLFAMGSLDVKRFKNFQNALQSAMGVLHEGRHAPVGLISPATNRQTQPGETSQASVNSNDSLEKIQQTQGLEAQYTPRGIKLTLNDSLLFRSGSARLTDDGVNLLERVGRVIKPLDRRIRVEGHSDNVPIATSRYPSNWELSTARAVNVVKYFVQRGRIDPHLLSAAGYADVKPRVPNDSKDQRAKNRRVEIILGQRNEAQAAEYQQVADGGTNDV
jgi:chemotaxis protein MotB